MAKKDKKTKKTKGNGPSGEMMKAGRFRTPPFIASYAQVFEARESMSGDMKYSISMIFPPETDLTLIEEMIESAAVKKFGADKKQWPKNFKNPLRDGNEDRDGVGPYKDAKFMNATSKGRPGLVDTDKNELYDDSDFYSGCIARATLSFFAYDKGGGKGVGVGLQNIQKLKEGEPLDGRVPAEDDF